jgi:hypothetical protein
LDDVADAWPAFVLILARGKNPERLTDIFLVHSAEGSFGADSIVSFNDHSDFILKMHDSGLGRGKPQSTRQFQTFQTEVFVLRVAGELTRRGLRICVVGTRPDGTPHLPFSNRSAVLGCAPARLNWPASRAIRHAEWSSRKIRKRSATATLAPLLRADFHLSREQYGWILGAFSITYAASAPFAGMLIDRIGLTRGISLAVGVWSCAGIATGFTSGLAGLVGCRAVLGAAEAGGIPSAGKAIHIYLRPSERAVGNAKGSP